MTPEVAIRNAFPGKDELSKAVRVAYLRILHAAENADGLLERVADELTVAIEDPPWSLCAGIMPDVARRTATRLRLLADALENGAGVVTHASRDWRVVGNPNSSPIYMKRPAETEPANDGSLSGPGEPHRQSDTTSDDADEGLPF